MPQIIGAALAFGFGTVGIGILVGIAAGLVYIIILYVLPVLAVGGILAWYVSIVYRDWKAQQKRKTSDIGPQRQQYSNEAEYIEARIRWLDKRLKGSFL